MHQIYRILRDNKEKGPLSLDELLQLSLKHDDLIWVDGQSAGWRYPSEIDSLKSFIEIKPEPSIRNTPHPASQSTRVIASPAQQPAPVYQETASSGEEDELTAEKLEKKANELYQRIQAFTQQSVQPDDRTQTKYARSLDDLKQEYADWLHHSKQKKTFPGIRVKNKLVIISSGVALAALIVYLMLGSSLTQKQPVTLKAGDHYVQNASTSNSAENKSPDYSSLEKSLDRKKLPPPVVHKEQSVDEFIDSINHLMAKSEASSIVPYRKTGYPKKKELTSGSLPIKDIHYTEDPEETNRTAEIPKKTVGGGQLVNMNAHYEQESRKKNISSLEVTIQNTSDALIRTVTVDVFYYKKGERLFEKETLYFRNIPPGNSMTVSKPGNKKAVSARFQLGQVDTLGN